jgi:hypothetical protein
VRRASADATLIAAAGLCGACIALYAVGHRTYGMGYLSAMFSLLSTMLRVTEP